MYSEPKSTPTPTTTKPLVSLKRGLWLLVLWLVGVGTVGVISYLMRLLLHALHFQV